MRPIRLVCAGLVLAVLAGCQGARPAGHSQTADTGFDAAVEEPAAAGRDLRVVIDEAHDNFHTASGRYAPFVELLTADGFEVEPGTEPFTAPSLDGVDLLVIANAGPPHPDDPDDPDDPGSAFSAEEVVAVETWVRGGGALLLIADHAPFGVAARELGAAFGVGMEDGHLRDPEHADTDLPSPYVLRFERSEGMIGDHPITRGRSPEERIDRVVTFGGQALQAPEGARATPLLLLADTAEVVADPAPGPDAPGRSAAGMVQAVAIEHGDGRVVVLGEAAVFTSQVITGPAAEGMGREELRIGMSRTDTDDRQLALNTVRWLAGLL